MSNNEWVREGTPRDDAEWTEEQDDYGVPVEPAEWDDYSSEQSMPVPTPTAQPEPEPTTQPEPEPTTQPDQASEHPFDSARDDTLAETGHLDAIPSSEGTEYTNDDAPSMDEESRPRPLADTDQPDSDDNEATQVRAVSDYDDVRSDDDDADAEHVAEHDDYRPAADDDGVAAPPSNVEDTGSATALAGLYRPEADETQVIATGSHRLSVEDEAAEDERRNAQLRADREARDQRLGVVPTSTDNAAQDPRPLRRRVGPLGSFGLFILRLVTAAVIGVLGYQILTNVNDVANHLSGTLIPEPRLVTWIVGFALVTMAVFLVLGLAVRVVGFLLAALAIASLVLVRWGNFSVILPGMEGFLGDKDLLLAGIGVALLSLGGGRFGIDGAISTSREKAREARYS